MKCEKQCVILRPQTVFHMCKNSNLEVGKPRLSEKGEHIIQK